MKTLITFLLCATSAWAVDGTWTGNGTDNNYSNTGNWQNATIAFGTDATMTVTKIGPVIVVDTNAIIGTFSGATNGSSMFLRGSAGKTLKFRGEDITVTDFVLQKIQRLPQDGVDVCRLQLERCGPDRA